MSTKKSDIIYQKHFSETACERYLLLKLILFIGHYKNISKYQIMMFLFWIWSKEIQLSRKKIRDNLSMNKRKFGFFSENTLKLDKHGASVSIYRDGALCWGSKQNKRSSVVCFGVFRPVGPDYFAFSQGHLSANFSEFCRLNKLCHLLEK